MQIEIDEQTAIATLLFGTIGWALYQNPQYQEPAVWVGAAIAVGWAAVGTVLMLGMFADVMFFDAIYQYLHGDENGT